MNSPVSSLTKVGHIAVVTIDSPPVNALGQPVRKAILDDLTTALADTEVAAIIILCAGRTFFAGADITEFGKPFLAPELPDLFGAIEQADRPVIAAIHGTALGGGLELAMSCHYRIAVPSAKLGLPEVALGLLPGAGGTQRTPRLAGIAAAVDLMVGGKPVSASHALKIGLIDRIADGADLAADAVAYAQQLIADKAPLRRARDLDTDLSAEDAQACIAAWREKNSKAFVGFKAPDNILKAIAASADRPFDDGIRREAELFQELMASPESAAQRHIFFAERAAAKIPVAKDVAPLPIASVAVIGAGTMGSGITLAFLNAGYQVRMIDISEAGLARGARHVEATLHALADKGRISQQVRDARIAAFSTATSLSAIADDDLIVEAVFERLDLKQQIFREIDGFAKPGAILASNTSFLDLNQIAAATQRPADVVGLHFFAPANIMRLLEVVQGAATSDAVLATAMNLGRKLGKVAILSQVCDGFIANRVMARRTDAADRLLPLGVMPWDVDAAMTGYGFPMGPFQMMDLVGLDVIGWDRENSAGRTVQEVLCEAGRLGQKSGGGYYDYDEKRRATPSPFAEATVRDFAARSGLPLQSLSAQEIVESLLYPVVNECAKLLEEGIALRASDIDMALVAGYAWPVYRGGPMIWADQEGLPRIVAALEARIATGEPIALSPLLKDKAQRGETFL
ncbi:3-hydroxyacyl-CoA dehydrogenase [Sphingobium lactosutens]|uniref:3-hydroxyacyl-CoA dehydrogenase NAD-binding domain-containing protein n=1 Tax=Sphingobium lactosutens TaxID=522773 RepID=UPI0015BE9BB5|nr:3-hydroxyacyl-CoA dehydrogenase NAD-binding domain-containing protein [Sphingobium lactosutens]NWK96252.1 3-hydroxyacyl-CoA dehydrogenase [Sphingobium lactosutens]